MCPLLPPNPNPPQVENPSQFIQGYRVLFRQTSGLPSPGPWQIQDLKVASERDVTLADLKKGIVYEIKVRPYFNEFQGADSESMTARTMEEGKGFARLKQGGSTEPLSFFWSALITVLREDSND